MEIGSFGPVGSDRQLWALTPTRTNPDGGTLCGRVRVANSNNGEGDGWVAEIVWAYHPPGSGVYGSQQRAKGSRPVAFSEWSESEVGRALDEAAAVAGIEERAVEDGN